jgi:hypothetical protein
MTADLPVPPAAAIGQAAPGMFAGVDMCLPCVLLVVCPPAGIAWLCFSWHRSRTDPDRRLAGTGGPALLGDDDRRGRGGALPPRGGAGRPWRRRGGSDSGAFATMTWRSQ